MSEPSDLSSSSSPAGITLIPQLREALTRYEAGGLYGKNINQLIEQAAEALQILHDHVQQLETERQRYENAQCVTCGQDLTVPLHAAQTWQPISSAPKDGKILVANSRFVAVSAWYHAAEGRWYTQYPPLVGQRDILTDDRLEPPTHWMPLPAPPVSPQPTPDEQQK